MGLMGLMGKKETHETLAHCCTIFLKSHLGIEIYMIDIEIQISISERSSDWAINYYPAGADKDPMDISGAFSGERGCLE